MDQFIKSLGGTTKVARALNLNVSQVSNWSFRGVPWRYRVQVAKLAMVQGVKLPKGFLDDEEAA